jgi:hypothetical protein
LLIILFVIFFKVATKDTEFLHEADEEEDALDDENKVTSIGTSKWSFNLIMNVVVLSKKNNKLSFPFQVPFLKLESNKHRFC